MSERTSDSQTREKDVKVGISFDHREKLRWLAQKSNLGMGDLTEFLIDIYEDILKNEKVKIGQLRAHLKKAAKKAKTHVNELVIPQGACSGLVIITNAEDKEHYHCIRGSPTGTVKIKKMTAIQGEMENVCTSCLTRVNLESRWNEILEKDRQGVITDHTYCTAGSEFDEIGNRVRCVLVKTWISTDECFVIDDGKVCPSLKTLRSRPTKKTGIKRRTRK